MRPQTESSKRRTTGRNLTRMMVALLAAGFAVPTVARAQTWGQYGVNILPMPLGSYSLGGSMVNDAGQVAGSLNTGGVYQAFLWSPGSTGVTDLGTLGGNQSTATGINASGEVTGNSFVSGNNSYHAFLYDGTSMHDLGTLGGTYSGGVGINTSGEVTGLSTLSGDQISHAFLYDGTSMHDLGTLGGNTSVGIGINASGEVTGNSDISGNTAQHAFLYNNGMMNDLGTLGGTDSQGWGINASGEVVGYSYVTGNNTYEAFMYDGTIMRNLGALLGATNSLAYGISKAGDVVGEADQRAALWEGGTGYFLNAIKALDGSNWTFSYALGISSGGTILAYGTNSTVNNDAGTYVVLKPNAAPSTVTPEPAPILLLATGLIGLAGVSIRKRRVGTA